MGGRLLSLLLLAAACGVPAPPDVPALAGRLRAGDPGAAPPLLELLGAEAPADARLQAYRALVEDGAPAAEAILGACRDRDPVRREHALALVGNLKPAGALEAASEALADEAFPRRYVAAWTLGELGDPRGAALLVRTVARGRGEAARESARSLVKLGPPAVPVLLAALPGLGGEGRASALRVLGEIRDPAAVPALEAALADPATRADAAWALGTLGRGDTARALRPLLTDPDWRVRLEVARSLGLLEDPEADGPLDRAREGDGVTAVREWAARSLALLRGRPQTYPDGHGRRVEPENLYR